jgi:NhaP-type Na+/H+ or K+/H+ antiporter
MADYTLSVIIGATAIVALSALLVWLIKRVEERRRAGRSSTTASASSTSDSGYVPICISSDCGASDGGGGGD